MNAAPRRLAALWLAAAASPVLEAAEISSMYDRAALEQAAPRYRLTTDRILNDFAFKYLTAAEIRRVSGVSIEYPLFPEGKQRNNPLAFYVRADQPRIVFPILSMKFLHDLSTAYAWLSENGYVIDTISEYTAMLAHKGLTGRCPPPLPTLGIPANALQNKAVDDLAIHHFTSARMFIVLHELGHLYYGHVVREDASSIRQEIQADRFALEVMRRASVPPLGMLVFFLADASMTQYPPKATSHPLSGSRLQAFGAAIQDPETARDISRLGELLDDKDTRAGAILVAKASDERTLAPRRTHRPTPGGRAPAAAAASRPFHGRCFGQVVQRIDPRNPMPMEMELQRNGNVVKGWYNFGLGRGDIEGTVTGDTLYLDWSWSGYTGRGTLTSTQRGASLSGAWGHQNMNQGGGTWTCRSVK